MKQITLDYQARGFKIVTVFGDVKFEHLKDWMKEKLQINLDTCVANSHVPRAESAIIFVKERPRSIQCETPFDEYPKRLTIKMTRRVTVLINHSKESQECTL